MQIGDDGDIFIGPIERAVTIHDDRHVSNRDFRYRRLPDGSRPIAKSGISVHRATPILTASPPSRVPLRPPPTAPRTPRRRRTPGRFRALPAPAAARRDRALYE